MRANNYDIGAPLIIYMRATNYIDMRANNYLHARQYNMIDVRANI